MDGQVNRLVDKVWRRYLETPDRRLLIAIAGIPGSGKTTLAHAVAAGINKAAAAAPISTGPGHDTEPVAMAVSMDGFHLTRAQLSTMPDPEYAHARRGAEFTFDAAAYLALVERLRAPISREGGTVLCPSFDHAVKDPVPDAVTIGPHQRVVFLEGNYVCLDQEPWRTACDAAHVDERWFVAVTHAVARHRLVRRHLAAGIAADVAEAGRRADENDLVNGAEIEARLVPDVDERIVSTEDATWE